MWRSLKSIVGTPDTGSLSAPVRKAIAERERESEVLVGYLQLFLVGLFAVLYAIAPSPSADTSFMPVPYALTVYALLTLGRVAWARRTRIPDWALYVSILIDMGLLMVLIWSFHLQYGQTAPFYLKAPTLLYVFFFIALRALRFEPRFVLAAGVAAAIGWGVLLAYVLLTEPAVITRDYVVYLTSNAVLLGAEFDKIISILVVTAILALAIARGRDLLIRAFAQEAATRNLSRFFDPAVAKGIAETDQPIAPGEGVVRDAAILNVDIRGFSHVAAQLPPAEIMSLLADYQARVIPVIAAHGGVIDKFLGDGIMATFGATTPSATYAKDALTAAGEIMAAIDQWLAERGSTDAPSLKINVGVASGRVVFGAVGDASRLEFTVIGDAVNLSAKIEKHNKEEGVRALCTQEALAAAVAQGYPGGDAFEMRAARRVDGVNRPLDLVVLAR